MKEKFKVICAACRHVQSKRYSPQCEKCGGLTEAEFDLSKVVLKDSDNPYERYFDLIPVLDKELLPKKEKMTPLIHAQSLGEKIGLSNLYLKNETANPTGTTKYKMAAISLPYLFESGVKHFCTSSTGNSSTAYATLLPMIPDLEMSLFTGSEFRERVNYESNSKLTHYILHDASFAEAFVVAAAFADKKGHTAERGFFNLGRREGLKLAWLESVEQIGKPIHWYVQAVSSAMGVYGTYKASKELKTLGVSSITPKLLCAQQASCQPMVQAWEEGAATIEQRHIVEHPKGIAKAILRGDPTKVYPYMKAIVDESGGAFSSVVEDEIKDAQKLVLEHEGVEICFSAATAVASVIKLARNGRIGSEETILVNLTGSDRVYDRVPDDVIHLNKVQGEWVDSKGI
ncbi:MAG: pyridoxal-5'-phosphate-dependent protein subunit beta [Cycloclasticus sp.]|nr:MAG: pyridoxal-5'-phosphate-dependent protein subunit beta [Cycloclasticus sp.]